MINNIAAAREKPTEIDKEEAIRGKLVVGRFKSTTL